MSQSFNTRSEVGQLVIKGGGGLHHGPPGDGFEIAFNGVDTLNIDALNANDTVRFGENVQTDVQMDGATTDLLWDASAGSLTNGGFTAGFYPLGATNDIAAGAGGAISITNVLTTISTDAGGDAFTLANGTVVGQIKTIQSVLIDGDAVITPVSLLDGDTITFGDTGDSVTLMWNGTAWLLIGNNGGVIA
jgi:hypothetical protein